MSVQLSNDDITKLTKSAMYWYIAHDPETTFGNWVLAQFYSEMNTTEANLVELINAQRASEARLELCGLLHGGSLDPEPMLNAMRGKTIGGKVFEL